MTHPTHRSMALSPTPLDDVLATLRLVAGFLYGFGVVLVAILLVVVLTATSLEAASDLPFRLAVGKVFFGTSSGTLGAGLVLLCVIMRDRHHRMRTRHLATQPA